MLSEYVSRRFSYPDFLFVILVFPVFNFITLSSGFGQQYTSRDKAEISYAALLTLKDYEALLDLISQPLSASLIDEVFYNSYANPQTKIFYSEHVIIEDNIRPSDLYYPVKKGKKVKDYLNDFDLDYVKSNDKILYFSNFRLSDLKHQEFPFLQLRYTSSFRGKHKEDTTSYKPVERVAEIRAEKKNNQWHTYIIKIAYHNAAMHTIPSAEGGNGINTNDPDDNIYAKMVKELISNSYDPAELQQARALAAYVAGQDSLFQAYMQEGNTALQTGNFKEALYAFTDARQVNPYDRDAQGKILEVNQLILNKEKRDIEIYQAAVGNAAKAKEAGEFTKARQYLAEALAIKPHDAALKSAMQDLEADIQQETIIEKKIQLGQYHEAILDYNRAIAADPSNPGYYLGRGRCYEKLKQVAEAIKDYSNAIRLRNDFEEALGSRALLYFQAGNANAAIADYSQLIALPEHTATYLPERARVKIAAGDVEGAIEDLNAAIKLEPGAIENHFDLGVVYADLQLHERAVQAFTRALSIDSQFVNALYQRAMAYLKMEDVESASMDFQKARKLGLNDKQLAAIQAIGSRYLASGQENLNTGNYEMALDNYARATLIFPENAAAWIGKGDGYFGLEDYKNAIHSFGEALLIDSISFASYKRGLAHQALRDQEAAAQDFKRFVAIGKWVISKAVNKAEAWCYLGHAQWLIAANNDALVSLNEAIKLQKDYARAFFFRGSVYFTLQEYKNAIKDLEQSIASGMVNPEVINLLGEAYIANDQVYEAIDGYSYIINTLDAGYGPAYKSRAACYKMLGEYELALQDLESATLLNQNAGEDPGLISSKGLIQLSQRRFREAEESFDKALSIREDDAWALYGKACLLAGQKQIEKSLVLYRRAFQTKQISWSAIEDDPLIEPVIGEKAFQELVKSFF